MSCTHCTHRSLTFMLLIAITVLLAGILAVNHVVHGFGCWGLQRGGTVSTNVYDLQILAAMVGTIGLLHGFYKGTLRLDGSRLLVIGLFALASIATFWLFGWATHTSLHHQGPENLVAYSMVAATTYFLGRYRQGCPAIESAAADARTDVAFTSNAPTTAVSDNPYEPPQSMTSK